MNTDMAQGGPGRLAGPGKVWEVGRDAEGPFKI